ncbi:hypothetical protein KFU94_27550 [Chloroflexi bacterium TSY]|nr:hypothetical protein [Chloroflexi bacterium TSY]
MRSIINITLNDLRFSLRNAATCWLCASHLYIGVGMGLDGDGGGGLNVRIDVIDQDQSSLAAAFLDKLRQPTTRWFSVRWTMTLLRKKMTIAAWVMSHQFGTSIERGKNAQKRSDSSRLRSCLGRV